MRWGGHERNHPALVRGVVDAGVCGVYAGYRVLRGLRGAATVSRWS